MMLLWKEMLMEVRNGTTVQEFTLEGFPASQHLGKVLFLVHLLAYLASIAGNALIVTITCADSRLQTTMYFFLSMFSLFKCCSTSTVFPKLLVFFLSGKQTISFAAYLTQAFVLVFLGAAGFLLIAVLSLDQYLVIYRPSYYTTIMNLSACCLLFTVCCALGFTVISGLVVKVSQLSFCGPQVIPYFFYDLDPLMFRMKISRLKKSYGLGVEGIRKPYLKLEARGNGFMTWLFKFNEYTFNG